MVRRIVNDVLNCEHLNLYGSLNKTFYEEAGADLARRQGYDGIICGHLHFPSVLNIDGIVYCNDGGWVENCTALVQDFDGNLSLVAHRFDHD